MSDHEKGCPHYQKCQCGTTYAKMAADPHSRMMMEIEGYVLDEAEKSVAYERARCEKQLKFAFLQGACWWEFKKSKGTMWQSDQADAFNEAERRLANGTLGVDSLREIEKEPDHE